MWSADADPATGVSDPAASGRTEQPRALPWWRRRAAGGARAGGTAADERADRAAELGGRRALGGFAAGVVYRALLEGGPDAIRRSQDPLIALARRIEPVLRELRDWQDQRLRSVETSAGQQIAAARFAAYGKTVYPDATVTLRLGYGRVLGYEEDTTLVPWKTTLYGLYDRAESFAEKPPYNLPPRWKSGRDRLSLSTPINFVYTVDTIGGNSGSPIVNRNGELVGLNFDSNQQKLPNRYLYVDEAEGSRAIAVHVAAIVEALAKLYGAQALVGELLGT